MMLKDLFLRTTDDKHKRVSQDRRKINLFSQFQKDGIYIVNHDVTFSMRHMLTLNDVLFSFQPVVTSQFIDFFHDLIAF